MEPLRILIVDDEPSARRLMERALAQAGYVDTLTADTVEAARRILDGPTDLALVLLDLRMPGESGLSLLGELAEREHVRQAAREVEARVSTLERTRNAVLRAMCLMAEFRDMHAARHLDRVSKLSSELADELALRSPYAPFLDAAFLANVPECAALHDIGKIALPDRILLKADALTPDETAAMRRHTTVGREICRYVQQSLDSPDDGFIQMAADVAWAHHECWDGGGYPEGLRGA